MKKISAGLLVYRYDKNKKLQFLLAHPGGPFYKNKDQGYWSIVKGEIEEGDDLLETAKREFIEETGITPTGTFIDLGNITQKAGKVVYAWALEMNIDLALGFHSNTTEIDWPPRSGKKIVIPEIDKLEFFSLEEAKYKINQTQSEFIDSLSALLNSDMA